MMPMCWGSRLKLFIVVSCVCQPPVALLPLALPGWAVAAPRNAVPLRPVQAGDARPRTTRIAASWDQPCHEKASRRAKAVVWVRQVIQATTGRPFQLCYSGPTAATSPLFTCSTARPGSPGTSGTTGRVLLPDARHCASGEAHGDGLRPVRHADQATLGDKTSPRVAPACCRLPGDGCSFLLDEPQGAIAMHHHPTVIGRGPGVAALRRRCGPRAGQGEPLLAHLRG